MGNVTAEPSVTGSGPAGSGTHSRARASSPSRSSIGWASLTTAAIACSMASHEEYAPSGAIMTVPGKGARPDERAAVRHGLGGKNVGGRGQGLRGHDAGP